MFTANCVGLFSSAENFTSLLEFYVMFVNITIEVARLEYLNEVKSDEGGSMSCIHDNTNGYKM